MLDLEPIKRKNRNNKIKEIRIMSPGSYRVFYIHISEENNSILINRRKREKSSKISFQLLRYSRQMYRGILLQDRIKGGYHGEL